MGSLIPVMCDDLNYPKWFTPPPVVAEIPARDANNNTKIRCAIEKANKRRAEYFSIHTREPYTNHENLWQEENGSKVLLEILSQVKSAFEELKVDDSSVKVIEVHPSKKSTDDIDSFVDKLKLFYEDAIDMFPNAEVVVENSYDKNYLLSSVQQVVQFSHKICNLRNGNNNFRVGIALDIPQLLRTEELRSPAATQESIKGLFANLKGAKHNIKSIHLWGSRWGPNGQSAYGPPHTGDLNSIFYHGDYKLLAPDERKRADELKQSLLDGLNEVLSDEHPRYLVPEIKKGQHNELESIVKDLGKAGISFVSPKYSVE